LKFQVLELQVSDIETSKVQVSKVHALNIKLPKVHVSNIHISNIQVHISVLQETATIHVSKDLITNVNETIKAPLDLNINKDKLKQSNVLVPTGFEFDLNTTSTHVSSGDEFDHVSKNYLQDAEGRVEVATVDAWNDFHVQM
jgi:hypothetical protein